MNGRRLQILFGALFGLALASRPTLALAGGTCMLHPEAFKLKSDIVHWSMKISPGAQCIQGLRWSTIMIDSISVAEQPKLGRLLLEGPSFRYFSDPAAHGTDTFRLSIAGTSLRQNGTSLIEVDITVQ